uniref:DUF674 family protein n=1 Tax=Leersia perrieri TaxID=77586 RepID=A0A0D9W8W0_9ORYZ
MSTTNNGGPTVAVKLYIDKEKKKVLFAESDKDFVDVLFSFLTLPLGTIVRILGKQSQIGCLDGLYKSVESLSEDHFQTDACKAMLLRARNAAAIYCNRLKFIIFDDLQVAPASTSIVFPLLGEFDLHKQGNTEEKVIELNSYKKTNLLKRALVSKQCLTGLCFDGSIETDYVNLDELTNCLLLKTENKDDSMFNAIKITVTSNPCSVDNLYRSMNGSGTGCLKHGCQSLLLSPMAAPFFGCRTSVLHVQESPKSSWYCEYCYTCFRLSGTTGATSCTHYCRGPTVTESSAKGSTATNAYLKGGLRKFIVGNDLHIIPFTLSSTLQITHASKIPKEMLVKKELTLNKTQVLKLLRAALVTRSVLGSVFLPPKK